MSVSSDDPTRFSLVKDDELPPLPAVGTRVCGVTADGERFTAYVTEVAEGGQIRVGGEKLAP